MARAIYHGAPAPSLDLADIQAHSAVLDRRAKELGVSSWIIDNTKGGGTPRVVVVSDVLPTTIDDSTGQATADQVAAALDAANSAETSHQQAISQATGSLQSLAAQHTTFQSDIQTDVAAIQASGWDGLSPQQRTDIMVRILQMGLSSSMEAHVNHLIVGGVIAPPS